MSTAAATRNPEIYPTKRRLPYSNEVVVTGYAVQFEGSDECIECHSGNDEENKRNAQLCAAAPELLEALKMQICPLCEHTLGQHADKYGCEHEGGDRWVTGANGTEGLVAQGPCGCKGGSLPDIQAAIAAIRKAVQS